MGSWAEKEGRVGEGEAGGDGGVGVGEWGQVNDGRGM